jgi:hypothetical protein
MYGKYVRNIDSMMTNLSETNLFSTASIISEIPVDTMFPKSSKITV